MGKELISRSIIKQQILKQRPSKKTYNKNVTERKTYVTIGKYRATFSEKTMTKRVYLAKKITPNK